MVRHRPGKVVLISLKKVSKVFLEVGIFLARDRAISVKNSLNYSAISIFEVISLSLTKSLRGSFDFFYG